MTARGGRPVLARRLAWTAIAVALGWLIIVLVASREGNAWQVDFRAYVDAAQRFLDGGGIYQAETLGGPFRPGPLGLYLYAPPFALAMVPFTLLPGAGLTWWLLHVAALALTAAIVPVRREVRVGVFVVAAFSLPALRDLALGNVSVLVLLGSAAVWRWKDSPIGGLALALTMLIRPVHGVVLLWAVVRRRWVMLGAALLTLAVIALASLPFVGVQAYLDFLTVLRNVSDVDHIHNNLAPGAVAVRMNAGPAVETAAIAAWYVVGIGAVLIGLRRDADTSLVVTLTATMLLGPLLWQHYLTLLLLPAALLADRGRPVALGLPLLAWLPPTMSPVVAITATILPLLLSDRRAATISGPDPMLPDAAAKPGTLPR